MGTVWVVGSLNVDRPWRVARHPVVGETVVGDRLAPVPGGKGLNQAVAARRMGADVVLVGRVGDDDDGRWLVEVARAEGIDTSHLSVDPDRPTGTALIVVGDDGANTVTVSTGANAALAVEGLTVAIGDVVVAQLEVPADAVAAAFGIARQADARCLLNPSPIPATGMTGVAAATLRAADVVVVNEHEAALLAGTRRSTGVDAVAVAGDLASAIASDGARAVDVPTPADVAGPGRTAIVTLGARGAVAVGPEGAARAPGVPASAVDTTGAGDCFLGVLAAGLASGRSMSQSIARANRAAALQVTRHGAADAMPALVEVGGWAGPTT